jgi:hypothetical protein
MTVKNESLLLLLFFTNTNLKTNFESHIIKLSTMVVHTSHHHHNDMTAVLLKKIITLICFTLDYFISFII